MVYLSFLLAYFLLISIYKSLQINTFVGGWFNLEHIPFWLGGLVGTTLPDIDHLIYVYFIKPHELTSQRVDSLIRSGNFKQTIRLLDHTGDERKELVFHNASFQMIFWVLVLFVVTSGGSLFGLGLVLAFSLHLAIDYAMIIIKKRDPRLWFRKLNINLTYSQYRWYLVINISLLVFFGLFA